MESDRVAKGAWGVIALGVLEVELSPNLMRDAAGSLKTIAAEMILSLSQGYQYHPPTVKKWNVLSGKYLAAVFLHREGGFNTPINKGISL